MAECRVEGVAIRGIVSALPEVRLDHDTLSARFGAEHMAKVVASTGIGERRAVAPGQTAADLGLFAAGRLLDELDWPASDVGLLLCVTQTPDFGLPANALVLHRGLGLAKTCAAFDLNLGCSGFVYGLWQASALMRSLKCARALLVAGDATSTLIDPDDQTVVPLFGDAVCAVALEVEDGASMAVTLGSDGAGAPYLIQRCGGQRTPGDRRSLFMDGTQVFAFTLREVEKDIRACLALAGWTLDDVDHFVLHQANAMMLQHLARKLGIPVESLVLAMEAVGNTSSASVPLAMTLGLGRVLSDGPRRLLMSGFGVGWSWGSVAMTVGPLGVCTTVEMPPDDRRADLRTSGMP